MRLGLRVQIGLTLLLLTAGAVWLIGLGSLSLTERALLDQAELTGRRLTAQIAALLGEELSAAEPLGGEGNRARIASLVAPYHDAALFEQLEVYTSDGHLAAGHPDLSTRSVLAWRLAPPIAALGAQPSSRRHDDADWGATLVVDVPIVEGGRPTGTVRAFFPLADSVGRVQTAQLMTALYTSLSAILIFIVGYALLTRLIVSPIRRIGVAAQRVAAGDHASRIVIAGSHNELGAVASNLNEMLDRLADQRAALQQKVEALAAAKAELETAQAAIIRSEKLASVGRLAAGVAHEVGNPLAAILGLVEVLQSALPEPTEAPAGDAPEDDVARDLLGRIEREVMRIHNIIRELLDYARGDADALAASEGEVVVAEAVENVCKLVKPQPKYRRVALTREIEADLPRAAIHQDRLVQVLLNLLMNAADALGGEGNVVVTAVAVGSEVCVSVRDDGPGISEEVLAHLFEPFYTTKAPGQGTGLGLAICERIVERAGGRIEVEAPEQGGVAFHVWLPAVEVDLSEVDSESAP